MSSRQVAGMIGKTHAHLMRDIQGYVEILKKSIESKFGFNCGMLIALKDCAGRDGGWLGRFFIIHLILQSHNAETQISQKILQKRIDLRKCKMYNSVRKEATIGCSTKTTSKRNTLNMG